MPFDRSGIVRDLVSFCARYPKGASGAEYGSALRALVAERYPRGSDGLDKAYQWVLTEAGMDYHAARKALPGAVEGVVAFRDVRCVPAGARGASAWVAHGDGRREFWWVLPGNGLLEWTDRAGKALWEVAIEELGGYDADWVALPAPDVARMGAAVEKYADVLERRAGVAAKRLNGHAVAVPAALEADVA